jgi:hypothetical protein
VLGADDRGRLAELVPVLRRAADLEPRGVVRLRLADDTAGALVRLPFGVLVARTVRTGRHRPEPIDVTVRTAAALDWLDSGGPSPAADDAAWRTGLPPSTGWQRWETVPDEVVRGLVRSGALALKAAAEREGVPGAQPRAQVADALLDSVVLSVSPDGTDARPADVTLRALSALTRMGFLPRGGAAHVDVAGRWIRLVAEYGTVYLERPGAALTLR